MNAVNLSPSQSEQLIYNRLRSDGIPDPLAKYVTAQSGHETDGWTSHVYLSDNNAFGYGYTGDGYKVYPGVEQSADDLAAYLNRRAADGSFPPLDQITDPLDYANLLKQVGYYTDSSQVYGSGILKWLNNNLVYIVGGTTLFTIFVAIGLLILMQRK